MEVYRPTLILDCDGLLSDFTGGYLDSMKIFGYHHTHEEVDRYEIHECEFFKKRSEEHLTRTGIDLKRHMEEIISHNYGWCSSLRVLPEAQKAVEILNKNCHLFVVTSPWDSSPTWMSERHHWLIKHFGLRRGQIVQTGSKHIVWADVFVDDKLSNVEKWQKRWPNGTAILFDAPYNKNHDYPRKGGWDEVMKAVQRR